MPITRQAVATTPSAAVKLARRAGYPVEVKPFGHDLPTEPAGCPVERNVTSDAMVRAAFTTVLVATGGAPADATGVIIRETPPQAASSRSRCSSCHSSAGPWCSTRRVAAPSPPRPPAPADRGPGLAAQVAASRAGDPDPDRTSLANLLRRASHLVIDLGDCIARLDLPRVIAGGRGARTLVVDDAAAELR